MRIMAFLAAVFIASPALADFDAAAEYSASFRGVSMVVIENGEVVFENYPNDGAVDQANPIASGTKSFIGLMAAAAVDDGYMIFDEKVSDTITEWQGTLRENITIRQLLTLTAGLPAPQRAAQNPPFRRAITVDIVTAPDTVFIYGPVPFQVFGELMKRKLNRDPVEYLTERVLDPIGVTVANWRRDRRGDPLMAAGVQITARDWAQLGAFVLARGEWEGTQVIRAEVLDELFVGTAVNPTYGITWWLNEPIDPNLAADTRPLNRSTDFWQYPDELPSDLVLAAGVGDQRLYVSRERNMVVVRQAEGILGALMGQRLSWSDVHFWRLLEAPEGETPELLPSLMPEEEEDEAAPTRRQRRAPAGSAGQRPAPNGGATGGFTLPSFETLPSAGDDVEAADASDDEDENDEFVGPTF